MSAELRLGEELISPLHPVYDGVEITGPARPPYRDSTRPVWVVTGYDDARTVLTHPDVRRDAHEAARVYERATGVARQPIGAALSGHMLNADPPDHTRLRSIVGRAFTSRRVAALAPVVEAEVDALLDALAARDVVDLMGDFAVPLTITVICELLGVSAADREHIATAWEEQAALLSPADAQALADRQSVHLAALLDGKRREPGPDLLSELVRIADSESRLRDGELVAMTHLLLMSGFETTMNMIGNALVTLITHPEQRAELRADPELLPGALEELARHDSPVCASMLRFTAADVDVHGTTIPAGEFVLVSNYTANHDERRFPNPGELDLHRRTEGHLGYGHGVHYCLGAPLARMEARIAIGRIVARFPDMELAVPHDELYWLPITFLRALTALPVRPFPTAVPEESR